MTDATLANARPTPSVGADRLVLLGTKGGPAVPAYSPGPASSLLVHDNVGYVIDTGHGVTFKLVESGFPLTALSHVLITHHHSDHNLDLGALVYNAWAGGLDAPVAVFAPDGVAEVLDGFWQANRFDVETRIADEGRPDPRALAIAHVYREGVVLKRGGLRVSALRNHHPPIAESYALKFEFAGKTVVFSGDTAYFPPLADFARGADILVHEVLYGSAIRDALEPNATRLLQHLTAAHTRAEDVGRIAQAANVKRLVLNHFVPANDPRITEAMWKAAVAEIFAGEIVVGRDLMEFPLA